METLNLHQVLDSCMLGADLGVLRALIHLMPITIVQIGTITIPILQMGILRVI